MRRRVFQAYLKVGVGEHLEPWGDRVVSHNDERCYKHLLETMRLRYSAITGRDPWVDGLRVLSVPDEDLDRVQFRTLLITRCYMCRTFDPEWQGQQEELF